MEQQEATEVIFPFILLKIKICKRSDLFLFFVLKESYAGKRFPLPVAHLSSVSHKRGGEWKRREKNGKEKKKKVVKMTSI